MTVTAAPGGSGLNRDSDRPGRRTRREAESERCPPSLSRGRRAGRLEHAGPGITAAGPRRRIMIGHVTVTGPGRTGRAHYK